MNRVYPATPYRSEALGSSGNARCMLIRQYCFPNTYSEEDKLQSKDHDRIMCGDFDHFTLCLEKYGMSQSDFERGGWFRKEKDERIIRFMAEFMKADKDVNWTGYRVMATVNRSSNGHSVFSLSLFCKHPKTDTAVYSAEDAPNVISGRG
jgi:hypothetical protein